MFSRRADGEFMQLHFKVFVISLVTDSTITAAVPGEETSSYNRMATSTSGNCPHFMTTPANFEGSVNETLNV